MAEITDHESLEAWLKTRPREDAVLIAAGAALRVLPLVGRALDTDAGRRRIQPTFRAMAIASLAGKWPRLATEVRAAAWAAACAAARAAAVAAAWAAARAANPAAAWAAVSLDATALEEGTPYGDFNARALWPESTPVWAADDWSGLKKHLLDSGEDWQVWTGWYDAILEGRPLDPDLELRKALIPDDVWKQGPAAANAEIAQLIAEHEAQGRDGDSPIGPVPERGFKALLTDAVAAVRNLPDPQIVLPSGSNESVKGRIAVERAPGNAALRPRDETADAAVARPDDISTVAFFSYTRSDDRLTRGIVSAIRKELQDAVSLYHGAPLDIFQDQDHIEGGDIWRQRLEQALAEATIFVPLITPAFFNSVHCREELSRFLARGDAGTLVLPIHFIDTDFAASEARDELRAAIKERQWLDWRPHQRQTRINKRLRDDIHRAARLILTRWRAARPDL